MKSRPSLSAAAGTDFSEPEIDHFVMAITAAEAIVRQYRSPSDGLSYRVFAAELIGWENSDAHEYDTSVCRCRHFDGDCIRGMGGFACACFPLDRSGD